MKKWIICLLCLFCINPVNAQETINFAWDLPTQNSNGEPLTDLGACRLYVSNTSGGHVLGQGNEVLEVPASTNAPVGTVTNTGSVFVEDGLYYFVVTAVDTNGNESGASNEISVNITVAPNPPVLRLAINFVEDKMYVSVIIESDDIVTQLVIEKSYNLKTNSWTPVTIIENVSNSNVTIDVTNETNTPVFYRSLLLNCNNLLKEVNV